ncbi:MAG: alanine racemase [Rhizobiales bacterium]|nr:alanine racemase [Hyphomicrobiales bacterium]
MPINEVAEQAAKKALVDNNYKKIKQFCLEYDENTLISTVVKANSYGLGMFETSMALYEVGCRIYYVATPEEGIKLRMKFSDISIYILDGLFKDTENLYQQYSLVPCLSSLDQIRAWYDWGQKDRQQLPCVIHFNTGINRLGVELEDYINIDAYILDALNIDHILSHFASADEPLDIQNIEQINRFEQITQKVPEYRRSFGNSAAIALKKLQDVEAKNTNILRPGIAIFGVKTTNNYPIDLEPVVEISARILQIIDLKKGDKIGYNHTYICDENIKAAVISAGYADGLFRALGTSNSNQDAYFYFDDYKLPILGRISMDMTVVDVSNVPEDKLREATFVEIIGTNISLEMMAEWSNTISYEILTNIGPRFQKRYI